MIATAASAGPLVKVKIPLMPIAVATTSPFLNESIVVQTDLVELILVNPVVVDPLNL